MGYFNKVMLLGNLTRDPELRVLPSDTKVVDFGLATSRKFKTNNGEEREEVLFVDCSAFGRSAELIHEYCRKGRPLLVEGRLKYDTWEDRNSGQKRHKLSVVVESFQFLGSREEGGAMNTGGERREPHREEGRREPRRGQEGPSRMHGRRKDQPDDEQADLLAETREEEIPF